MNYFILLVTIAGAATALFFPSALSPLKMPSITDTFSGMATNVSKSLVTMTSNSFSNMAQIFNMNNMNPLNMIMPCNITMTKMFEQMPKHFANMATTSSDYNKMMMNYIAYFMNSTISPSIPLDSIINWKALNAAMSTTPTNIQKFIPYNKILSAYNVTDKWNFFKNLLGVDFDQGKIMCFLQNWSVYKCTESDIDPYVTFNLFTDAAGNNKTMNTETECPPNPEFKMIIIIHGYQFFNPNNDWINKMASAYKQKGNYNVIAVNWIQLAKAIYPQAVAYTKCVGNIVGKFVLHLQNMCNIPSTNVHIIGHSLGAHVAGFAGKICKKEATTPCLIETITGLDPAGPYFEKCDSSQRLCKTDAKYVVNYHADNMLGTSEAMGTHDIFLNGGTPPQPGCDSYNINDNNNLWRVFTYSHIYPIYFYIDSFLKRITAVWCKTYLNVLSRTCDNKITATVGEGLTGTEPAGLYFCKTGSHYPV